MQTYGMSGNDVYKAMRILELVSTIETIYRYAGDVANVCNWLNKSHYIHIASYTKVNATDSYAIVSIH